MKKDREDGFLKGIVRLFLQGNLSILLLILALLAGTVSLLVTPREEEPQIIVPLADIFVHVPGASAREVERQVTTRLEKLLYQIDGVEYVYSMSKPELSLVTVRFYVGEDREESLVKIYNKIESNIDRVPVSVAGWVVKPIEVDDVPIVNISLYSDRYDDAALLRLAEEVEIKLQSVENTNKVTIIGGRPRAVRVGLDQAALAAHSLSPLEVAQSIRVSNIRYASGSFDAVNREFLVDGGIFLTSVDELRHLVVGVQGNKTVRLSEVARVMDLPKEVTTYTRLGFGPAAETVPQALLGQAKETGRLFPSVHIAVAKKKGTNAVWVARDVVERMEELKGELFPDHVYYRVTRNYGITANQKVNELVEGLVLAIIVVIGLIFLVMGWREAVIVAVAIPVTFSFTLLINYFFGYTINRVTLFALTLALGIVVDDPIVCVENISRHFSMQKERPLQAVLSAVHEILPPIILATAAVVISFLPLFFITGMMGPYMRPMAFNVPVSLLLSLVVALTLTPWLSFQMLKGRYGRQEEPWEVTKSSVYRVYKKILPVFMNSRLLSWGFILLVAALFGFACWLAMARYVPLKMLPFDNKNEFQIIVDMPEGTSLETTDAVTIALGRYLMSVPEVTDFQTYAGCASAMDFNGMVRHYYLRQGANVGEVRVNVVPKHHREQQSHSLVLRLRDDLTNIARAWGANIKLVEMPPGPPVIATITAEVRGLPDSSYNDIIQATKVVRARMEREAGVVDVDDSFEQDQVKYVFITDKGKAALSGISTDTVARTLKLALSGTIGGYLREPDEVNPLEIVLILPREKRSSLGDLRRVYVKAGSGKMITLGEIGHFEEQLQDKTIYHKNLERIGYVFAEMAGRAPAEAIMDMEADRTKNGSEKEGPIPEKGVQTRPVDTRTYFRSGAGIPWTLPQGTSVYWSGEGEWDITVRVFRDLGIAFGTACFGIYLLLVVQTGSYVMPLILMISIGLTIIGIMPGFWLLNILTGKEVGGYQDPVFFTATSMIGMIALSGIAVRNAILLIEFVHEALRKGMPLDEALIQSGAVRLRPIFLTAITAGLAAIPITLDPIFSGLAWALIFGLVVSTAFTLLMIPVVYWLIYWNKPGHGLGHHQEAGEA
jgi:multidrug efflux pump subunit AcrB